VKPNGATHAETRHSMNAPSESEDPDLRVHAAWLAQVSEAAHGRPAKQVPQQGGGRPSLLPSSLDTADCLVGQQVRLAPPSRRGRRSGAIMVIVLGCIFAMALAVAIPPRFALFDSWRPPTDGGKTEEKPLKSATPAMGNEASSPKLIIDPSVGVVGEPAPIGLSLRGGGNDAIVIIRGLLPGMELSTGSAIADDTWQLSAADLPYAWIAPPKDFVGSADLVAELRLPSAQIADRQTLHVKWTRPAQEREQIAPPRQDNEMQPPVGLRPFSIGTIGAPSQQHHRSQPNLHRVKSTGNTVKVFAHAERTICARQSMKLIDAPPSRTSMSARAAPRSKDFGIGRVDHPRFARRM
jgi:hypothetical protein